MKLTDGEKLITLMLCELYDKLQMNSEIDPDFLRTAIYTGNEWSLAWKYPGIPFEDQKDPEQLKEILDILDMWEHVELSYDQLSPEDKTTLDALPFGKKPRFFGFDGNNEAEYIGITSILLNELDRFQRFKGRDLNAHMPTLDIYHRMLPTYNLRRKQGLELLGVSDLSVILSEIIHPEKRKS
ncbi:YfbU family protein [Azotobacter beijerinckii]|uniref:YfbU family protein n=1 Tax=Azotobacter beijerinckii TaxID=170623 RepID=UPI000B814195|nr:YfbU family protein [Azotobacter beijerinckii]